MVCYILYYRLLEISESSDTKNIKLYHTLNIIYIIMVPTRTYIILHIKYIKFFR